MTTTTIRVNSETRDRLNELAASDLNGATIEQALTFLLDEHWKAKCIAQADRWREEHPDQWRAELEELALWESTDINLDEIEGPYKSDDPDFIAAGGTPMTKHEDVA